MNEIPHAELERWRNEFPILQTRTYLNSCSLGALSRRSMGYLGEYQALWNTMGASAWYELWVGRLAELRGRVAELLHARPGETALVPSVSAGLSAIASAVDYSKRNKVVVAELDFPTQIYQWMVKRGVDVVRVPSDDGIGIDPARWAEAIDDRTALVATSHVFYSTGYIQDLRPIAEAAHRHDALFVVDGYHGAGQLPVDPRASGADVYLCGPLKWLLGGPGLAYLWVGEERIRELQPSIVSWFGAKNQFDFEPDRFEYRDDAARFELGTPALPTMYTALGGIEIILEVGMQRIRERNAALTDHLVDGLRARGHELRCADEPQHRSAIAMVHQPESARVVDALAKQNIIVDKRGPLVRVSPHFYNTAAEVDLFIDTYADLATR
jgi:kynureninase